jgi:type IV secretion system protein VirB11
VIPPVSFYPTLSIRKASVKPLSLKDFGANGFYASLLPFHLNDSQAVIEEQEHELQHLYEQGLWDRFMHSAILAKKNIVISGGTSSGKTTYLNACLQAIDREERLILLEDTRELNVSHLNHVSLLVSKGEQGRAKVDMQTLLQATLRLRPDRIIMGEIRGREIMDFVTACSTGHEGSITSIHANNPRIAMHRMVQMYKQNNVPSMRDEDIRRELHSVIDIILQVAKTSAGRAAIACYYKGAASHAYAHEA